jgi:hypothetical protein
MSEVLYFQRYHKKENMHSSNALLLLKKLYFYKPKLFYEVIRGWTADQCEICEFLPQFESQIKEKTSIPDLRIQQAGFEIAVEAKEKYNDLTKTQLEEHIKALTKDQNYQIRMLVCLSPTFSSDDDRLIELLRKEYADVIITKMTYKDLYNDISERLLPQDEEFREILEEFDQYCNMEGLIDDANNTIMAVLCGQSLDVNVKYNLYYCLERTNCEGFRYIGLYKDLRIQYIGKITKIVSVVDYKIVEVVKAYSGGKSITDEERARIEGAISENRHHFIEPTNFYLVEKYVPVDNFKKITKHGLMGRKKFHITDYVENINLDSCTVEDIATLLKNQTWGGND